jgi:hypothetical protein
MNIELHRWEEDVVGMVEDKQRKNQSILLNFGCETLKADDAAEEHIRKYMPNLAGLDAVGTFIMPLSLSFLFDQRVIDVA